MDIDFNTQKLVLKPEYVDSGNIIVKNGYVIKLIFDTVNTPESEYEFYYNNGLDMIFDIVDI